MERYNLEDLHDLAESFAGLGLVDLNMNTGNELVLRGQNPPPPQGIEPPPVQPPMPPPDFDHYFHIRNSAKRRPGSKFHQYLFVVRGGISD